MQVWCQGKKLGRRIPAFNFRSHGPHMTSWAHWLGAPKPSPHSLCCIYDNYEATRIQRIPFIVAACFFVVASICKLQGPSATAQNRRRPARTSRSLLALQFFWHFRLKRGIAMPAIPDQRSRRVCLACVFVFCVREQSQASHA
jgi:hypothetical protein